MVVAHAGAAPDDLLELGHRADHAREDDVLAGRGVHAGGEELGGGEDGGRERFRVLEAAEVAAPDVALVGGDTADVVGVLAGEVAVEVGQRAAHLVGVRLIDAEDDRLGEAVGLLEEAGQVAGDRLGAGAQGDDPLEVLGVVLLVGDGLTEAVELTPGGAPAGGVVGGDDAVDAVGGEEAVFDPLAQAVLVDRVAEVAVGGAVVGALRRGGHAELVSQLEVVEDFAPVALVFGAAAVAFVDDDQVEEVGRVLAVEAGAALVAGEGLVGGEVEFAPVVDHAPLDLPARVAEGGEGLVFRVVHENVAVGEVEDLRATRG